MVLLHLPKHSPVAQDLVLPPAWACHLPFSPYLPSCDHLCTPATSELLRAGFFLFPRKSSSSPEGRCQAHFWSPTFPESCGCYPPPRASENGRCISRSTLMKGQEKSLWARTLLRVSTSAEGSPKRELALFLHMPHPFCTICPNFNQCVFLLSNTT